MLHAQRRRAVKSERIEAWKANTVEDSDIRDELDSVLRFLMLHHPKVFKKYTEWRRAQASDIKNVVDGFAGLIDDILDEEAL